MLKPNFAVAAIGSAFLFVCGQDARAAVILADAFDGVSFSTTADFDAWDTVNGIDAPSTSLAFIDGDSSTQLGFLTNANVPAGEILPNNNMTAGGWDTSIDFVLAGVTQTIDLTSAVFDLRLATSSGADNTTASKSGQMLVVLTGSVSGLLGTASLGGDTSYPSVEYQRTVDLTGLPTLTPTEDYTLTIQARGTGFGHLKSLQALEINGDVTIPEPASLGLLGLAGLALTRRKR